MQKGFVIIPILIGILVLGGVVGAWYTKIIQIPGFAPPGCYYKQVQCIQAPCNPILVCSTSSPTTPVATSQPSQATPSPTSSNVSPALTGVGETVNPDSIGANWKTFQSQKFTFMYPSGWLIEDPKPYGQLARLTYMEGGDKYKFIVETGGRGGPTADNIENQPLMFQGFKFNRRTWINAGKPFFISFAPDEGGFEFFNHVEISLPPENTDKYIKIFDQILSTFKFQ